MVSSAVLEENLAALAQQRIYSLRLRPGPVWQSTTKLGDRRMGRIKSRHRLCPFSDASPHPDCPALVRGWAGERYTRMSRQLLGDIDQFDLQAVLDTIMITVRINRIGTVEE